MMKYYRDSEGTVFGYDETDQGDLIAQAIAEEWEDVTASWPPAPTVTVPVAITPRQGLIMLSRAGLLASVQAAVAGMEGQPGEEARIDFERASEWRRDWPLLNALASGLGMTSEQIDQMFISASSL